MRATYLGMRVAVIALIGYWIALFIATHIPANRLLAKLHDSDKIAHFLAFAGLSFLMAWAISTRTARWHNVWIAAIIGVVYAAIDELLQIPVGRTADWKDFVADCTGVVIGLSVYAFLRFLLTKFHWTPFRDPDLAVSKVPRSIAD